MGGNKLCGGPTLNGYICDESCEVCMLDAYIIRRIRNKDDAAVDRDRIPLRIEVPLPSPEPEHRQSPPDEGQRGIVEVDFNI